MKKLLFIIAAFAITFAVSNAAFNPLGEIPIEKIKSTDIVSDEATPIMNAIKIEGQLQVQGGEYSIGLGSDFGGQMYQTNAINQTPISYEPYTGTLFLFSNRRSLDTILPSGDFVVRKTGPLLFTNDLGQSWALRNLYDYTENDNYKVGIVTDRFYTSLATVNPKKSSDFNDVKIAYRSWVSQNDVAGKKQEYKSSIFGFISGEDLVSEKVASEAQIEGPWSGTAQNILLQTSIMATSANVGDHGYVYFSGRAWAKENSVDTTQFVLVGVDVTELGDDAEDLLVDKGYGRNINEVNKYFGGFEAGKPSTYLTTPIIDVDNNGNIYMLTLELGAYSFAHGETNNEKYNRIPRIFKSAPDGQNFQLIDSISDDVVNDYLNSIFAATDKGFGWYLNSPFDQRDCFVALEENHYVFVADLFYYVIGEDGNERYVRQLTEFEKKNGIWKVRAIDMLNTVGFLDKLSERYITAPFELYIHNENNRLYAQTNGGNQRSQFEIQLAKTADGRHLVTKYINLFVEEGNPNSQIATLEDTIDLYFVYRGVNDNGESFEETREIRTIEFPYAQTFLSYRSLDSDEWSTPVKAINSDTISTRYTMMPHIVPSINEVPLVFCITYKRPQSTDPFNVFHCSLPPILANNILNNYNFGMYQLADATRNSLPYNSGNIKEGRASDKFVLGEAYPNPTDTKINFEFSLGNADYTTLTIYNSLGQVVGQAVNEYLNERNYTVSFETSNLPVGTYYYVLKSGNIAETKIFNIVR